MKLLLMVLTLAIAFSLPSNAAAQTPATSFRPWWETFGMKYKALTPEEERLQKFWHDHSHSLNQYYSQLDHVDWVSYYKNHEYQVNGANPRCRRCNGPDCAQYAPVFVPSATSLPRCWAPYLPVPPDAK